MKKIAILSLILLLSSYWAHSQDFKYEVYGGVSLPSLSYPEKGEQAKENSAKILSGHLGFRTIAPIIISLNDNMLYAGVGLAFSGKGFKTKELYKGFPNIVVEGRAWSIDAPARLGYRFCINDKVAIRAELGYFVSLGLFGSWTERRGTPTKTTGDYYSMDNREIYGGHRIDNVISSYLGAVYNRFTAGVCYDHGIPNRAGRPENAKSRNIQISVGYLF